VPRHSLAIVLLSLTLAGLSGCDEPDDPEPAAEPALPEMAFRVDETLLGEPRQFGDGSGRVVTFRPPADWAAVPESQMQAIEAAVATGPSTRPDAGPGRDAKPLAAFVGADQSVLIVSAVPSAKHEDRLAALREVDDEVLGTRFAVRGLPVSQYLVRTGGRVNFKVVIDLPSDGVGAGPGEVSGGGGGGGGGGQLQLDYVTPQARYGANLRAIESSLGSLGLERDGESAGV
jgi:hypothetical protein